MSNLEHSLRLSQKGSSEGQGFYRRILQRQKTIAQRVLMVLSSFTALPAVMACSEEREDGFENIGVVQQSQWMNTSSPTWGQNGGNASPNVHYSDTLNGTALFSSNQGGSNIDILCSKTSNGGGSWTAEQPVGVLAGTSVNSPSTEHGVTICADNPACPTPKIIFDTSRSGTSIDLYWGDINLSTCQASNVGPVGGDINQMFISSEYPNIHQSTGDLYYVRGGFVYWAVPGVFIKQPVNGLTTTVNTGVAVFDACTHGNTGTCILVSATDCPNGQGGVDLCIAGFDPTTHTAENNMINLNDFIPGTVDDPNNAEQNGTADVDEKGILRIATGPANNTKIKELDPINQGGSGGSGGNAGSGGSGGSAGSGGSGGSGSGGMAGSGGVPEGGAGQGGAGGEAGAGGACCDGGGGLGGGPDGGAGAGAGGMGGSPEGGAGQGGTGGSPEGGGGAGASGAGGSGGSVPTECFAEVSPAENFIVENCDYVNETATIRAIGTGTIKYSDKTKTITNVVSESCTYQITLPNQSELVSGFCEEEMEEPANTPVKYVDGHLGDILGAEGSKKRFLIPAELNPRKNEGVVDVIGHQILDSSHFLYDEKGCQPVGDDLSSCDPKPTNIKGASKMNEIPEGTTLYKRLSDGKYSTNPDDFKDAPVIPPVSKDPEGCGCNTPGEVSDSTRADLMAFLLAAGLIMVRRRRNGFVGVEVEEK